jgi:hypothetical protein
MRLNTAGEDAMAFKPNYNQQRAERNRAKQAKQEAKRQEREEQVARRRQLRQDGAAPSSETDAGAAIPRPGDPDAG